MIVERNAPERRGNYYIYCKVRYFLDVVVPKFCNAYKCPREVFGLKVYMLAEAKTGYVINIDLAQSDNTVVAGQKIVTTVMNICAPYHDLGYHLYMDNWYTCFGLCVRLWDRS